MTLAVAVLAALILLPLLFLVVDLGRGEKREVPDVGSGRVGRGDPVAQLRHEEDLHYRRTAQARR